MYKNKGKWRFKVVFEILLDVRDIYILEAIKEYFGLGTIYISGNKATYRIIRISDLLVIINHFKSYPLIFLKLVVFGLWSEVVLLMSQKRHLNSCTFNYIMTIYAALGRGPSKAVMESFPNLIPIQLPAYILPVNYNSINCWWISDYFTLYCTFSLRIERGGWKDFVYNKFRNDFSAGFNIDVLPLVKLLAEIFGCSYYLHSEGDRVILMAQSTKECDEICNFFKTYPLQSYKQKQFLVWKSILNLLLEIDFEMFNVVD